MPAALTAEQQEKKLARARRKATRLAKVAVLNGEVDKTASGLTADDVVELTTGAVVSRARYLVSASSLAVWKYATDKVRKDMNLIGFHVFKAKTAEHAAATKIKLAVEANAQQVREIKIKAIKAAVDKWKVPAGEKGAIITAAIKKNIDKK